MRSDFCDAGSDPGGIGSQIGWPQGTDLSVSADTCVRVDGHYGGIKDIDTLAARPFINTFTKR